MEKIANAYSSTAEHRTGGATTRREILSERYNLVEPANEAKETEQEVRLVDSIMKGIEVT